MTNCFECGSSAGCVYNDDVDCPEIVFSSSNDLSKIKYFQPVLFEIDATLKKSLLELIKSESFDAFIRTNYEPINLDTFYVIYKRRKTFKKSTHCWCNECFEKFSIEELHRKLKRHEENPKFKICKNPTVQDLKLMDDFQTCDDCRIEIHGICYSCAELPCYRLCRECFYKAREFYGIRCVKNTPLGYTLPSFGSCER